MKNWVKVIENDFVGQILFKKDVDEDGNPSLSITVYNTMEGVFICNHLSKGDDDSWLDSAFEKLANEQDNKTINRIAEQLVMF